MASKEVIRLVNRIQKEFGVPVDPEKFYRSYIGKHQRAAGECSWVIYCKEGFPAIVGGIEPIVKYINSKNRLDIRRRSYGGYVLYAYAPGEPGYDLLPAQRNGKTE